MSDKPPRFASIELTESPLVWWCYHCKTETDLEPTSELEYTEGDEEPCCLCEDGVARVVRRGTVEDSQYFADIATHHIMRGQLVAQCDGGLRGVSHGEQPLGVAMEDTKAGDLAKVGLRFESHGAVVQGTPLGRGLKGKHVDQLLLDDAAPQLTDGELGEVIERVSSSSGAAVPLLSGSGLVGAAAKMLADKFIEDHDAGIVMKATDGEVEIAIGTGHAQHHEFGASDSLPERPLVKKVKTCVRLAGAELHKGQVVKRVRRHLRDVVLPAKDGERAYGVAFASVGKGARVRIALWKEGLTLADLHAEVGIP